MTLPPPRLAGIDGLKAVCSQLIVLHHLAFYGPMSDIAYPLAPALIDWLYQYARIAVQVFLVIGGFLAIRSLAPAGLLRVERPWTTLLRRYRKLVVPFGAAILLSITVAALARRLITHDSIPDAPELAQLLAHLLLLHDVIGVDALSAGVWYVAIDFQLFALLLVTLWLARLLPAPVRAPAGAALVVGLVGASLWWFNRDADWDRWALYFFGAYGLGVLAYWASEPAGRVRWLLTVLMALALSALWLDFRARIAVASLTALGLGLGRRHGWLAAEWGGALTATLGRISYSVFLVHFPVCVLFNAVVSRLAPGKPWWNAAGMVAAWIASNIVGALFYRYVESADLAGVLRRVLPGRLGRSAG